MKVQNSNSLSNVKNIGSTIEKRLLEIGIHSLGDLADVGAVGAYKEICEQNPSKNFPVCYYLYSLQGALLDLHWNDIPEKMKLELKKQVKE